MNTHVKGALSLLIIGAFALAVTWVWKEKKVENAFYSTSDAAGAKDKIRIAVDSWVGYYPLCSSMLKRRLREVGYALECVDDGANYKGRMEALERGEFDFAVATIDSFVSTGASTRYPGVIVAVIDESKGGDAIISRKDKVASLEALKSGDHKVAITANSPSDYLAKSVAVHFDIEPWEKGKNWRHEVGGSSDALKALQKGSVDVAVLWEPDVSRALKDEKFVRLMGTEKTERLIVDVLIAQRERSSAQPEKMKTLLRMYFNVLKELRENNAEFEKELKEYTDLSATEVSSMVTGVKWMSLSENAEIWLAHTSEVTSQEAVINTINSVVGVLKNYGDFSNNPIPDGDAYRLVNSSFVHEIYQESSSGFVGGRLAVSSSSNAFPQLSDTQWDQLKEVGSLKMRAINFSSGSDMLALEDKEQLDELAENLSHYSSFRVEIRGHSGIKGDAEENKLLSQSRAEAVVRYLDLTHGIPAARMRALGFGGEKPLKRLAGESDRSYGYRLPRVEIVLKGAEL